MRCSLLCVLWAATAHAECALDLLDAGAGDELAVRVKKLSAGGFAPAHQAPAKKPRAETEIFFIPQCEEAARQVAELLFVPANRVKPQDWKSQFPLTVALAKDRERSLSLALLSGITQRVPARVKAALEDGASATRPFEPEPNTGELPLQTAAGWGDLAAVTQLIARGADVNARGERGRLPLSEAACSGQVPVASLLLEKGAKLEVVDSGSTAFSEAVWCSMDRKSHHHDMINFLLSKGALIDGHPPEVIPLSKANTAGVVQLLLERGAKIQPGVITSFQGADVVEALARAGADPNTIPPGKHAPPLHECVDEKCVTRLVAAGADPNRADRFGVPALVQAREELVPALIAAGAKVNTKDARGWTPLHFAASRGNVPALLAAGADVNAVTTAEFVLEHFLWSAEKYPKGCTPLDIAKLKEVPAVIELLKKARAKEKCTLGAK